MSTAPSTNSYFFFRERDQTLQAREQAQIAQALNDFVTRDVLQAANPDKGVSVNVTLKNAVINATPEVAKRFSGQPLIEALIDSTLARTMEGLSEYSTSLTMDQRAAKIYADLYGATDRRTLKANASVASDLLINGRETEAGTLIESVLNGWGSQASPLDPDFLHARYGKLLVLSESGSIPSPDLTMKSVCELLDSLPVQH